MRLLLLLPLLASSGCYYGHLAVGQSKVLWARQSVDDLLSDEATESELRAKLETVREVRAFATMLGLEVSDQYTSYVDWPGDRIVTTVVATRARTIEPAYFRFPIIGKMPYKGYFALERAEREAERLRNSGLDVCLIPVTAYSTLGWLADPLTAPMVAGSIDRLVETVFHELLHATVFLKSQPDFNEGAASFVGEEAAIRFYSERQDNAQGYDQSTRIAEDREINRILMELRSQIADLYGEEGLSDEVVAERRSALVEDMRDQLRVTPFTTRDSERLAEYIRVNDACLALQGTYASDTPRHQRVLEALDGDLERFIARLLEMADEADPRGAFFGI